MTGDRLLIALCLIIGLLIVSAGLTLLAIPRIPKADARTQATRAAKRLSRDTLLAMEVADPAEGQQLTALWLRRPYANRGSLVLVDTDQLIKRGAA